MCFSITKSETRVWRHSNVDMFFLDTNLWTSCFTAQQTMFPGNGTADKDGNDNNDWFFLVPLLIQN
jgi:hypothetical protein